MYPNLQYHLQKKKAREKKAMSQDQTTPKPQEHKTDIHTTTESISEVQEVSNVHTKTNESTPNVSNFQSTGEGDTNVANMSTFTSTLQKSDTSISSEKEGHEPTVLIVPTISDSEPLSEKLSITSEKDSNAVITETIADPAAVGHVHPEYIVKKYLVGLDGSEESSWAFNTAILQMDKSKDMLYLLSISSRKINDEKISKKILVQYAHIAERHKVQNVKLILGLYKDVPQAISQIVNDLKINFLMLGHKRNTNIFQRIVNPSITKHCLSTVECSVTIAQTPVEVISPDIPSVNIHEEDITEMIQKRLTFNDKTYLVDVLME
jgi:hypothetical protein